MPQDVFMAPWQLRDHPRYQVEEFELMLTCDSCPEQYDVLHRGERIGYMRLRHGHFTCEASPDRDPVTVYRTTTKGDGQFEDDERQVYMRRALTALRLWMALRGDARMGAMLKAMAKEG